MLGTGVLSLPLAFKHAGLYLGLFLLIVICGICLYAMRLICFAAHDVCRKTGREFVDYANIMKTAVEHGPPWIRNKGYFFKQLVNSNVFLAQLGFCCVYFVFMADNLEDFFHKTYSIDLPKSVWMVLIAIPVLAICSIRRLNTLAPFALAANVIYLSAVAIIVYHFFMNLKSSDGLTKFGSVRNLPLFFGTALYAFEGVSVVMIIENRMERPQQFIAWNGVLNTSCGIVLAIFAVIGFYGYLAFGDDIKDTVTLNLPDTPFYQVLKIILSMISKAFIEQICSFASKTINYVDFIVIRFLIERKFKLIPQQWIEEHKRLDLHSILNEKCEDSGILADLLRESRAFKLPVINGHSLKKLLINNNGRVNASKQIQLTNFGQLLIKLCDEHKVTQVFDIGCGLGHLLGWLAENSELNLFGIDYSADFCHRGSNLYDKVKFYHLDITDQSTFQKIFNETNERSAIVSLHGCGDVQKVLIREFVNLNAEKVPLLLTIGCCYHKMTNTDNNAWIMSSAFQENLKVTANKQVLRLASEYRPQNHLNASAEQRQRRIFALISRNINEIFYEKMGLEASNERRQNRRKMGTTLDEVREELIKRYNVQNEKQQWSDVFEAIVKENEQHFPLFEVYLDVQYFLQEVYEHLILLDRVTFIQENGIEAELLPVFNLETSPRSSVIFYWVSSAMSNQYKSAVTGGGLKLKKGSIFKADRKTTKRKAEPTIKADPDVEEHGGWWVVKNDQDFRGGIEVAIEAGDFSKSYISALDNGKFTLGPNHFNELSPHPEEVFSLIKMPDSQKFSLKTGFGRYIGVDLDGRLIATSEAAGVREQFEVSFQDDKCAIFSSASNLFLTWLPNKDGSIYVSSKTAGKNEYVNIRTTATKYVAPDFIPEQDKKQSGECETSYVKMYQHSRVDTKNRMINYDRNDVTSIKKAKDEGNLHEVLLNRRAKQKSDKYC
ncbi:Amino acid transporter, transmembrane family-containing protein [Aphelenchoides bicaudatus]|nr:Amino acid transporter, transmembrane family-containing protein [Aphelenchoides bicaudatus]